MAEPIDLSTRFETTVPAGHEARLVVTPAHPDPEVTAMSVVSSLMNGLPPAGRRRVADWAWARWHADPDRTEP